MSDVQHQRIGEIGSPGLILYDGDCVLCSAWFRFVAQRDGERRFLFTPIQSEYGRVLALQLGIDPMNPKTNAVILDGRSYLYSESALAVLSILSGWQWTRIFRIIPRVLRDPFYRLIARNRYRWFGRHTQCDLGGVQYRDRVVE